MTKLEFELSPEQPFIELNKVLQILNIAQTGGHAKILIQNEEVKVNGEIETRVRKKMVKSEVIELENFHITIK